MSSYAPFRATLQDSGDNEPLQKDTCYIMNLAHKEPHLKPNRPLPYMERSFYAGDSYTEGSLSKSYSFGRFAEQEIRRVKSSSLCEKFVLRQVRHAKGTFRE